MFNGGEVDSNENQPPKLSEEDIQTLFGKEERPPEPVKVEFKPAPVANRSIDFISFNWSEWLLACLKMLALFIAIFFVSFTILNFPALWTKARYYFQVERGTTPWSQNQNVPPAATINNHLVIPKIGVDTPIEWDVSNDKMLDALEKGVAHYQGTVLPGESGNVFVTGHSSYYLWAGGSYKQIFALLDKLEVGDRIYINYQNVILTYKVTGKKVVSRNDLSVLNQSEDKTLSLMTCVPIGTNLRRLVVSAEQISL